MQLLTALVAAALAQPGDFDRSFSGDGRLVDRSRETAEILSTPAGGVTALIGPTQVPALLSAFGRSGRPRFAAIAVNAAAVAGDGYAVVLHGDGAKFGEEPRIMRIRPDGSPDTTFGDAGVARIPTTPDQQWTVWGMAADGRGRITFVGYRRPADASLDPSKVAVRVTPRGAIDESFGSGGQVVLPDDLDHPVATTGGAVLLRREDHDQSDARIVRLSADGALTRLRVFRARRARRPADIDAFSVLPDGRMLLVVHDRRSYRVVRLLPDGRVDRSFERVRLPLGAWATAIGSDGRGRTLVAFQRDTAFDYRPAGIRRYDRRGRLDRNFGDGGRALIRPPRRRWEGTQIDSIEVDGRGRIVVAGRIETGIWVDRETIWHALVARLHG